MGSNEFIQSKPEESYLFKNHEIHNFNVFEVHLPIMLLMTGGSRDTKIFSPLPLYKIPGGNRTGK